MYLTRCICMYLDACTKIWYSIKRMYKHPMLQTNVITTSVSYRNKLPTLSCV